MPVAPGVYAFVLGRPLADQFFFPDARSTPFTTFAANNGSNEVIPLAGPPHTAGSTLEHDLLWAPPVAPADVLYVLHFVVSWDMLDYLHTITS